MAARRCQQRWPFASRRRLAWMPDCCCECRRSSRWPKRGEAPRTSRSALCGEGSVIGIVRRRARNGTGSSSSTRASPSAKRSSSTPPLPGRRRVSRSCGSHPASCRLKSATFLTNAAICWEKLGSSIGPNATASRTPADVTISCQFASGKNLRNSARPTPFARHRSCRCGRRTSVLLHPWRKFQQRVDQLPGEVNSSPP